MSLTYQPITVPLSGPLDTLADPLALQPPGLSIAENWDYGRTGMIRVRLGHSVIPVDGENGSGGIGRLVWQVDSTLWKEDYGGAASWDTESQTWLTLGDVAMNMSQLTVTPGATYSGQSAVLWAAQACNDTYRIWAIRSVTQLTARVELLDGTLVREVIVNASPSQYGSIQPIAWPDGHLSVVTNSGGTVAHYAIEADPRLSSPTLIQTLDTGIDPSSSLGGGSPLDLCLIPWTPWAVAAYAGVAASNTIRWRLFQFLGSPTPAAVTETMSGAALYTVAVGAHPSNGNFAVGWVSDGASNGVQARAYTASPTPTALYAVRNVETTSTGTNGWSSMALTLAPDMLVVYSSPLSSNGGLRYNTVDAGGTVGTPVQLGYGLTVASDLDPVRRNFWVREDAHAFNLLGGLYLLNTFDGKPSARALDGRVIPGFRELRPRRWGNFMSVLSGGDTSSPGSLNLLDLDYLNEDPSTVVPAERYGHATTVGGGIVYASDGAAIYEQGFLTYPFPTVTATNIGGGSVTPGIYGVIVTYYSVDARGDVTESTFDQVHTVTVTGAEDSITAVIPYLNLTRRENVSIRVYRSAAGAAATGPYQLVSSTNPNTAGNQNGWIDNDRDSNSVTFVDAGLATQFNPFFRDIDGSIDPVAPTSASICVYAKNRQWLGGGGDTPNRVQYSRMLEPFRTPEHNGAQFVDALDAVTALARCGDYLAIFTDHTIEVLAGDGPDGTGGGQPFQLPQTVSTDTGCISSRSCVETPLGVMFQSRKGIVLLAGGAQLQEIGAPVDQYGREQIYAATVVPEMTQVRFVQAERTLVYDYSQQRWSVHTYGGGHAVMWANRHAVIQSSGDVWVETEGVYTDAGNPYKAVAVTGMVRGPGVEAWMRLRRLILRGRWRSQNTLRISIDFSGEERWDEAKWTQHIDDVIPVNQGGGTQPRDALFLGNGTSRFGGIIPGFQPGTSYSVEQFGSVPGYMARCSRYLNRRCSGFRLKIEVTVSDATPSGTVSGSFSTATDRGRMVELYDITADVAMKSGLAQLRAGRNI